MDLNAEERDLLEWLSHSDFSQYGECDGAALDSLIAQGLAELMGEETERNNSFIAKGRGIMFRAVRLTERGYALAVKLR